LACFLDKATIYRALVNVKFHLHLRQRCAFIGERTAYAAQDYAFGLLRTTSIALSAADKKPEMAKRLRRSHDLRWQNSADVRSIEVADVKQ
jgi:hypothetical protein